MTTLGKKILIGIAVLFLIGIIANLGHDKDKAIASTEPAGDAPAATTSAAEKKWTEIFSLKGNGMKKSAGFALGGGKARIKYKYTMEDAGLFSFYVVPEGEDIMKTGGIPEVMIQQAGSSVSYITKEKGNYYLNVNSSGGNWVISVEEEQ
jgi:hypothetical protein